MATKQKCPLISLERRKPGFAVAGQLQALDSASSAVFSINYYYRTEL